MIVRYSLGLGAIWDTCVFEQYYSYYSKELSLGNLVLDLAPVYWKQAGWLEDPRLGFG